MSPTTAPRQRFDTVDAFRGIASLWIVIFHFPLIYFGAESPLIRHSYVLTNLFFGLSGFIMMSVYGHKIVSLGAYGKFVGQRFSRFYPLYLVAFVVSLLEPVMGYVSRLGLTWVFAGRYAGDFVYPNMSASVVLGDLLMLQGIGLFDSLHLNFPAWSLAVLFQASLLFGLAVLIPRLRTLIFSVLFLGSTALVYWKAPALMGSTHDFGLARCVSGFFLGALSWQVWQWWSPGSLSRKWVVLYQTAAVCLMLWFVTVVGIATPMSMLTPVVVALFILAFSVDHGDFTQVLTRPVFRWLADRSFALFLLHASFLFIGHHFQQWFSYFEVDAAVSQLGGLVALAVYLAVVLWAADLAHRHVELKFRSRRRSSATGSIRGEGTASTGLTLPVTPA